MEAHMQNGINHGPPASQAIGSAFLDSTGRPLHIFVEAAELQGRPRTVRTLKNNGAVISHSPEEASIILVDPQTASGLQFVQEWASEPGKAVLDVRWVQKSVQRGKAFLADEGWGGFAASENASEPTDKSPLPTPRETPPDSQVSQVGPNMQNQPPYSPPNGSQCPPGGVPVGYPVAQMSQQPQMAQQIPNGLPSGTSIPMAGIQPNPNAPVVLPAQLVAQLVGFMSQQGMNPATMGMPQMIPQMPGQMPMNMMQGQAIPQGYPQQTLQFMTQTGMFPPQYSLPQQQGIFPHQQTVHPHYQSPTPVTPDGHPSMSQLRRNSSMSDTIRGSPMEDVRSPSLKRKSPSMDRFQPSSSRVGGNGPDSERSSKHRRVSYPHDDPPLPYPDSIPTPTQPRHDSSSSHGKLFAREDGEPYKFFVQIDIRPRTKIADAIKKNGGKLVPDIADADYVILGSPSTRTFEERLKQAGIYGKLAVRPQWVFQCLEENTLVDLDDFVFEGMKIERKRGRPSGSGKRLVIAGMEPSPKKSSKDTQPSADEDDGDDATTEGEEEAASVKRKANLKGKTKAAAEEPSIKREKAKKYERPTAGASPSEEAPKGRPKGKSTAAKSKERSPSLQRFWRPSPPPPTRVVEFVTGRNHYTKEDGDYVEEYLPILLFRDPDMTAFAISEKLHAKMPHHSQRSWQTYISHATRREKFEKLRRQAHIARRKAEASGQQTSERVDVQSGAATQTSTSLPQNASPQGSSHNIDPFAVLAEFFASGGADNMDDADVWRILSEKHPVLSAREWEAYWSSHSDRILIAVEELSGVKLTVGSDDVPMQDDEHRVPKPEPE